MGQGWWGVPEWFPCSWQEEQNFLGVWSCELLSDMSNNRRLFRTFSSVKVETEMNSQHWWDLLFLPFGWHVFVVCITSFLKDISLQVCIFLALFLFHSTLRQLVFYLNIMHLHMVLCVKSRTQLKKKYIFDGIFFSGPAEFLLQIFSV